MIVRVRDSSVLPANQKEHSWVREKKLLRIRCFSISFVPCKARYCGKESVFLCFFFHFSPKNIIGKWWLLGTAWYLFALHFNLGIWNKANNISGYHFGPILAPCCHFTDHFGCFTVFLVDVVFSVMVLWGGTLIQHCITWESLCARQLSLRRDISPFSWLLWHFIWYYRFFFPIFRKN